MKILHLISSLDRGGAENHLRDLIKGQLALGHQIAVGFLRNHGELTEELESLGVIVKGPFVSTHYLSIKTLIGLRRFFIDFSPDLLHTHMPPPSLLGYLASRGLKIPWVASLHNDERFASVPGQGKLGHFIYSKCQKLIAISSAVKSFTIKEFSLKNSNNIEVIPYGLDLTPYNEVNARGVLNLKTSWGISNENFVLGCIARLTTQKSLDTLIHALKISSLKIPQIKLILVGAGPLEQSLRDLTRELKLEDRIIFAGRRTDIPVVLQSFDVFVLPSIYEGLGLVLLEAMAAGIPIIASRVSAIPEIVSENVTGLLFEKRNIHDLAEKIFFLHQNQNLQKSFSENGKTRVKEVFSLTKMVLSTDKVYQSAMEKAP